jgi:hypothetical protein
MTCTNGHAVIRVWEDGRWWIKCVNSGCNHRIPE